MKTASLVLGIIGGVLAIIFAIFFMIGGAVMNSAANYVSEMDDFGGAMDELTQQLEAEGLTIEDNDVDYSSLDDAINYGAGAVAAGLYIAGILGIIGGIMGIVGGALAKKKNVVAGILMLVAAVPSFFTGLGFIASILFIIGGILALIPDKQAAPPVQA
jgi:hypothetical protein